MTAPARFRQADLDRVFRSAKKARLEGARITLDPASGQIEIVIGKAANDQPPPVELK